MEKCPRLECNGTLVVEQVGGGKEITCRACGRHPHSPQVQLPPTPSLGFTYAPPWLSGQQRRGGDRGQAQGGPAAPEGVVMYKPIYDPDPIGCGMFMLGLLGEDNILDLVADCRSICRPTMCYDAFVASLRSPEMQASGCRVGIKRDLRPAPLPVYAREDFGIATGPGYCPCPDNCGAYIPDGAAWFLYHRDAETGAHNVGKVITR